MSERTTKEGAIDDPGVERQREANEKTKKTIDEIFEAPKKKEDPNSAAWNRGRNAADPSRKRTTKKIQTS